MEATPNQNWTRIMSPCKENPWMKSPLNWLSTLNFGKRKTNWILGSTRLRKCKSDVYSLIGRVPLPAHKVKISQPKKENKLPYWKP